MMNRPKILLGIGLMWAVLNPGFASGQALMGGSVNVAAQNANVTLGVGFETYLFARMPKLDFLAVKTSIGRYGAGSREYPTLVGERPDGKPLLDGNYTMFRFNADLLLVADLGYFAPFAGGGWGYYFLDYKADLHRGSRFRNAIDDKFAPSVTGGVVVSILPATRLVLDVRRIFLHSQAWLVWPDEEFIFKDRVELNTTLFGAGLAIDF